MTTMILLTDGYNYSICPAWRITMDNRTIAERLRTMAHDLESKRASLFRVRAYRRAAETILGMDESIEMMVAQGGHSKLMEVPTIGSSLARIIETLTMTAKGPA